MEIRTKRGIFVLELYQMVLLVTSVWTVLLHRGDLLINLEHGHVFFPLKKSNTCTTMSRVPTISKVLDGNVDMNSHRLTNLAEPTASADGVTKSYTDSLAGIPQMRRGARAYYSFEGNYEDSIGTYDGTANGNITISSGGKIGDSLEFNGTTSYVSLPSSALDVAGSDYSFAFWVYVKYKSSGQILMVSQVDSSNRLLITQKNGDYIRIFTESGGSTKQVQPSTLSENTWYHFTIIGQGTTGTIYLNGTQDSSGAIFNDATMTGSTSTISNNLGNPMANGYRIDEFGVWNRVLSAEEIKYLYHNGSGTNDFQSLEILRLVFPTGSKWRQYEFPPNK
eukprot:gb/GECG01016111.1/.p1 GENE.gb/GECG01016111.1/~~gb/GECG01016111.1/.p1  ORF type:complete len:336 (+),score=26.39 gb/GECG01016111.1/:1-1008(+)